MSEAGSYDKNLALGQAAPAATVRDSTGLCAPSGPQLTELAVGLGAQSAQFLAEATERVCLVHPSLDP